MFEIPDCDTCYWEMDDNLQMARTACSKRHPLDQSVNDQPCPYCGKEITITNEEIDGIV